ncbi:hypothetical protein F2Q69_00013064 [Brassica cretica]|uniref:Uncharacterized protein n=1 Tax=Brassica cretica TaxID=69181 RepID=A0A8S9QZB2_BRACR|nr:hypothetical protein F2Q69_00013064 [Brassica cretica]
MDSGIVSLSGAVAWASDSESLFVEPSGVLYVFLTLFGLTAGVFRVCRSLCSAKKQSLDCFWHPLITAVPFGVGNLMLRWYIPSSTRSNKETQLLFSSDPASLERSTRKEIRSSSIDNNTCLSLDFCHPPSTQTPVPSTDTRFPSSTEDTLPSKSQKPFADNSKTRNTRKHTLPLTWYIPSSTRSNKETQLLFSSDPASLERSTRKEIRSSSIDNNTCLSLDFCHPPSTQTPVPSTDTRFPSSTEDTLPSKSQKPFADNSKTRNTRKHTLPLTWWQSLYN